MRYCKILNWCKYIMISWCRFQVSPKRKTLSLIIESLWTKRKCRTKSVIIVTSLLPPRVAWHAKHVSIALQHAKLLIGMKLVMVFNANNWLVLKCFLLPKNKLELHSWHSIFPLNVPLEFTINWFLLSRKARILHWQNLISLQRRASTWWPIRFLQTFK